MAWVLTKQLQAWRTQMNANFPNRDKTSDGTIGDTAHQAETSGHNPDDTAGSKPEWDGDSDTLAEVRASDTDADTGDPNVSMEDIVQHLLKLARAGSLWFIRYIIYNRRIWRASNGWKQETYTGSNPHDKHMHMSGAYTQDADNFASANYHLEDLVAITSADADLILDRLDDRLRADTSLRAIYRALPWQYTGNGLQGAASTLDALSDSQVVLTGLSELGARVGSLADPAALATAVAGILVPAVVSAVQETVALTQAEAQEACERAVRAVLGSLDSQ